MPDKLHVYFPSGKSLQKNKIHKSLASDTHLPFLKLSLVAKAYGCVWKRRENSSVCGASEGTTGLFGQVCLWISGKQGNMIPAELQ